MGSCQSAGTILPALVYQGLQSTGIYSGFFPILLILCRWTNENVAKNRRAQKNPKHTVML
jgi:hypothetical protein